MEVKHHHKLTDKERDLLAVWLGGGISLREVARRLGRSVGTVSAEVKRNSVHGVYVAIHAQALTKNRIKQARTRHPLKSPTIYAHVLSQLRSGLSPEQISGRLARDNQGSVISYETIYQFIYAKQNSTLALWEYLPRKQRKRRRKGGRKVQCARIPDRVSIHQRPEEANERAQFGHWEGDTVEGKGHQNGIHTEVERVSRFYLARKITRITSAQTYLAQAAIFSPLPPTARRSTTLDNGKETHLHAKLRENLGMKTYHADPYSSWQRGTNEYHNGLLRRYLPKKTSFDNLTQAELDDITKEINNRPRKVLNYLTPRRFSTSRLSVRIES